MAVKSVPLPQTEGDKKTRAGNYFVSNYPPFSFWTQDDVPRLHEALEQPPADDAPLGLYMHIPFCRKRCHFCYFKVYTDKNKHDIADYLDAVIDEAARYADKPFLGGRTPQFVYFGGGTPSYISPSQLAYLVESVTKHLSWDHAQEIAFECEPGTLTDAKLRAIRDIGVTRLSLGIENFDDHILELNGRAHRSKEIWRAYDYAREIGFPQINIDLIAGMMDETDENWQRCIDQTLELEPDCITIYQMEIPFNTTIYKRMRDEGKLTAPVADWETKRRWVDEAFSRFVDAGYAVSSAYTVVRDPKRVKFVYRDALWCGADLLSLGVSSFGQIHGVHYQNEHHFEDYVNRVKQGELPIRRALPMRDEEAFIREFILQMKLGSLSFDYFRAKFDVDPAERFAPQLAALREEGGVTVDERGLELDRARLLRVDQILHDFFLPEHQNARYV